MKNSGLASLLVAIGLVSACSATGDGGAGSGLRGTLAAETGGNGGLTGGTGNVLGGSGGTVSSGTGGKGSGGALGIGGKFGTGGTVGGNAGGSGGNPAGGSGSGGSPLSGGTTGAGGVVTATGGAAMGGAATGGSVGSTGGTPGSGGSGNAAARLIGHWKFDDISETTTATTAVDSSGNSHSLTLSGNASLGMTGKNFNGLTLGGAGVASATFSLGTLNAMTVGLWVKSTANSYDPAVGLFEFGASNLIWDVTPSVVWTVGDDSGGTAPPAGEWHHLGAIWDAAGTSLEFCLDGVSVQTGIGSVTPITGSNQLSIGKLAADTDGFNGVIDDVRIYDRALTCTEIFAAAK